jgi:hypothetical protein
MTVDHIVPQAQDGPTTAESLASDNLCFACWRCNEFKGSAITGCDPLTGEIVPLFHPRTQTWNKHFAWDASGTRVIGLTVIGRATVVALNMNDAIIVNARRRWVSVGWHPPEL